MMAIMEIFALFNFKFENDGDIVNNLLRSKWPSKATQLEEINKNYYEAFLTYLILKFLYSTMMIIATGQEITEFRMLKHSETRSTLFRRINWIPENNEFMRIIQTRDRESTLLHRNTRFILPPRYEVRYLLLLQ